jgi:hypothetical protein
VSQRSGAQREQRKTAPLARHHVVPGMARHTPRALR